MNDDYLRGYSDCTQGERNLKLIKEDIVKEERVGDVNVYKIENTVLKND